MYPRKLFFNYYQELRDQNKLTLEYTRRSRATTGIFLKAVTAVGVFGRGGGGQNYKQT